MRYASSWRSKGFSNFPYEPGAPATGLLNLSLALQARPLDVGSSSLLSLMLWYGVALPALASAAVLLVSWPLVRRARPSRTGGAWSIALALGLGCAAGQIGVEGWRSFPPREVADRLFYLTFVAVALS